MEFDDEPNVQAVLRPCARTEGRFSKDLLDLLEKVNLKRAETEQMVIRRDALLTQLRKHRVIIEFHSSDLNEPKKTILVSETRLQKALQEMAFSDSEISEVINGSQDMGGLKDNRDYTFATESEYEALLLSVNTEPARVVAEPEGISEPEPPPDLINGIRRRTEPSEAHRITKDRTAFELGVLALTVLLVVVLFYWTYPYVRTITQAAGAKLASLFQRRPVVVATVPAAPKPGPTVVIPPNTGLPQTVVVTHPPQTTVVAAPSYPTMSDWINQLDRDQARLRSIVYSDHDRLEGVKQELYRRDAHANERLGTLETKVASVDTRVTRLEHRQATKPRPRTKGRITSYSFTDELGIKHTWQKK